jgi:hypothetical protein
VSWSGPLRYISLGAQGLVIARDIAVSQLFVLWALLEDSVRRLPRGWARQLYRNLSVSIFLRTSRHDLDRRVRYKFLFYGSVCNGRIGAIVNGFRDTVQIVFEHVSPRRNIITVRCCSNEQANPNRVNTGISRQVHQPKISTRSFGGFMEIWALLQLENTGHPIFHEDGTLGQRLDAALLSNLERL